MKDMSDLFYCPKCKAKTEFVIKRVNLCVYELGSDYTEEVRIICCLECSTPISACIYEQILDDDTNP